MLRNEKFQTPGALTEWVNKFPIIYPGKKIEILNIVYALEPFSHPKYVLFYIIK